MTARTVKVTHTTVTTEEVEVTFPFYYRYCYDIGEYGGGRDSVHVVTEDFKDVGIGWAWQGWDSTDITEWEVTIEKGEDSFSDVLRHVDVKFGDYQIITKAEFEADAQRYQKFLLETIWPVCSIE